MFKHSMKEKRKETSIWKHNNEGSKKTGYMIGSSNIMNSAVCETLQVTTIIDKGLSDYYLP